MNKMSLQMSRLDVDFFSEIANVEEKQLLN